MKGEAMMRLAFQGEMPDRRGLMATVRLGEKWIAEGLKQNSKLFEVVLTDEYGNHEPGIIVAVEYMQLKSVSDEVLRLDCNQPGRSWQSLYNGLVDRYSSCAERNQAVEPTSYVSVVYFIRK